MEKAKTLTLKDLPIGQEAVITAVGGEGALRLSEIQMVGGKRMRAQDYLRGHAVEKGTSLGA